MAEADANERAGEAPVANNPSIKDILTVGISSLALVISGATFTFNRLDASRAHKAAVASKASADKAARFNAYQLGKRLSMSEVAFTQTKGPEKGVAEMKARALVLASEANVYVVGLGLTLEPRALVERHARGGELFGEGIEKIVSPQLAMKHSPEISKVFRFGYYFSWLLVNVKIDELNNTRNTGPAYEALAPFLNGQAGALGVDEKMPLTYGDARSTGELLDRIRRAAEAKLAPQS